MQRLRVIGKAALVLVVATVGSDAAPKAEIGSAAPQFTLPDAQGIKHSLSDFKGKYVVLEWVNFDCPFVRKHYRSGNMPALQKTYIDRGVVWLSVCSSR